MSIDRGFIDFLNSSIKAVFYDALKASYASPALVGFIARTISWQKSAAKKRLAWEAKGLHVPPFMIASITRRCNLSCKGCYSRVHNHSGQQDMTKERWTDILKEARELGISIALLAGGEPFARKDLLDITGQFRDIVFPVFTNGLLIDQHTIELLKKQRNVVPIVSIEGFKENTDERRGDGVYLKSRNLFSQLKQNGVFFGASITVNKDNIYQVTSAEFINNQMQAGCRIFFFVEYVPVEAGTEALVLAKEQREYLKSAVDTIRFMNKGVFISFPGDEESFGGCLAAGRGFVHISPEGNLEPCPFAPFSDTQIRDNSIKAALQSEFLTAVRENHQYLTEGEGGCALWENREFVGKLLSNAKAEAK